jgi:Flp pilus assembly pilin Flp
MEYGLIAALIAVTGIAVGAISNQVSMLGAPVHVFPALHHGFELHGDAGTSTGAPRGLINVA